MAERRTNISKLTMHYGKIFHAQTLGKISVFNKPDLDERFLTLQAEDFPNSPNAEAWGSTFPILAHQEISYKGQPLVAVFGPDYEIVTRAINNIKYTTVPEQKEKELFEDNVPTESLEWGNITEAVEKPELKQISSEYSFGFRKSFRKEVLTCTAWQDNNMLNIEIPCQWPEIVKDAVANSIGLSKSEIIIHQLDYYAPLDEYLIIPALVAPLAALACIKLSSPIQLREPVTSFSPKTSIKRTSYCNAEGKVIAENVEMDIDQGAFPLIEKEVLRHALTGLLPNYPVSAFSAKARVVKSNRTPCTFFGSLSFADALTASQLHACKIAKAFDKDILSWETGFNEEKRRFTDYLPSIELKDLVQQATSLAKKTTFLRKWTSYDIQAGDLSLLKFSRGIALATSPGISGFSTSFYKDNDYKIKLTLNEKNNLVIASSLYKKGVIAENWALALKKELNQLEDSSISFNDKENSVIDSGPETLGICFGQIPQQLIEGCQNLISSKNKRPVSEYITPQDTFFPCEFENQGSVSIIIESQVDAISLSPVVSQVHASFVFGKVMNMTQLKSQLYNTISETIRTCGATFSTDPLNPYKVELEIKTNPSDNIFTLNSTLKGLVQTAVLSSFSQAIGKEITTLPISSDLFYNLKANKEGVVADEN